MPGAEKLSVTIGSPQLGLPKGNLTDLDAVVAQLNREQLALRTVAVLTGLFADMDNGTVNVSKSLAGGLGSDSGAAIAKALRKDNALFVEPMQQQEQMHLIRVERPRADGLTNSGKEQPEAEAQTDDAW